MVGFDLGEVFFVFGLLKLLVDFKFKFVLFKFVLFRFVLFFLTPLQDVVQPLLGLAC